MRQLGAIVARLAPGKMRKRPEAADHASPAPSVRRATSAFLSRSGIWTGAVLFVSLAFAGAAQAACDVNTASTSGVTANFTSIGQTIGICVSDNKVLYGLYSNQNVSANYNAPISNNAAAPNAGPFPYASYFATTAKATYLFVPIRGTAEAGAQEYDVTLQSVTGSGADQVTLYYSSFCQGCGTQSEVSGRSDCERSRSRVRRTGGYAVRVHVEFADRCADHRRRVFTDFDHDGARPRR